jgi:protocatechuate 3,4-dioxygenase beta subunit
MDACPGNGQKSARGVMAMRTVTLSVLVLTAALASPAGAAVTGRIIVPDGRPLAGARVEAYGLESPLERAARLVAGRARPLVGTATTAADGSFRLESGLAVVDLVVTAPGFAPAFASTAGGGPTTLVLRRAATARGEVRAGGRPVPHASVVWMATDDAGGSRELLLRTGVDGTYEVPAPEKWASGVLVIHSGFAPLTSGPDFPGQGSALRHELTAGVTVEGRAVDEASGRGVAGGTVLVDGWPLGRTAADGSFAVRHAPRDWTRIQVRTAALAGAAGPRAGRLVVKVSPLRRLSGTVRELQSRRPVAGAVVALYGDREGGPTTVVADAAGRYAFDLPQGRYRAFATHPGYRATDGGGDEDAIDLRRSLALRRDLVLEKLKELRGRVQDEAGRPVGGALVRLLPKLLPRPYSLGEIRLSRAPSVWTAPDGAFTLVLPADEGDETEWTVTALKAGHALGSVEHVRASSGGSGLAVTLPAGVELAGRVSDPAGAPIPDVSITVAETGGFAGFLPALTAGLGADGWMRSGPDGRFVTRVRAVPHELFFAVRGRSPRTVHAHDPGTGALEVVLDPAVEIRGRVVRSDGRPAPGLQLFAWGMRQVPGATAVTANDGTFTLSQLAPGPYQVQVLRDDRPVGPTRTVEAPRSELRIELAPTGAVRGHVTDARSHAPLLRFEVGVERAGGDAAGFAPGGASTGPEDGEDGAFVLTDVPAGEVDLTARAEGFVTRHVPLVVPEGPEPIEVEVDLDPGVTLRGSVTSEEGEPLSDVEVGLEHGKEDLSTSSDGRGEYELAGVPPGPAQMTFALSGFQTARQSVDAGEGTRVDVLLRRGLSLRGMVLADGTGVARANVWARSSVAWADNGEAVTDRSGRFTISGLSPGRYSISAYGPDGAKAEAEDVDVETAGVVRLELRRPPRAVLTGSVLGLPLSGEMRMVLVRVEGESDSASAPVDTAGSFRVEKAPAGPVRVSAVAVSFDGNTRSSRVTELDLPPGSETETVVEFAGDIVVSGTVIRDGQPAVGAIVSFRARGSDVARTHTDGYGQYAASGLEAGLYEVSVTGLDLSFRTEYEVTASAQLDIDATGAAVAGTVADATTGAPIGGAHVSLWYLEGGANRPERSLETSATGLFSARALREGRYRILVSMDGYGQEIRAVDLRPGSVVETAFELTPAEGLAVEVVDARDGRPLDAVVVVRDASRAIVANRHSGVDAEGALRIALAPGRYLLSTSAGGYGTATLPVTAPGSGLRVGLTPGGTLVIESARSLSGQVRLVQADGEEYVRCWCNGIASIDLEGRRTRVPNVTPGAYTVELLDAVTGAPQEASPVVIREGEVSTLVVE